MVLYPAWRHAEWLSQILRQPLVWSILLSRKCVKLCPDQREEILLGCIFLGKYGKGVAVNGELTAGDGEFVMAGEWWCVKRHCCPLHTCQ